MDPGEPISGELYRDENRSAEPVRILNGKPISWQQHNGYAVIDRV